MRVVEKCLTSADPKIVWRVLADVEHWRDWTPTIIEIKPVNDKTLTAGARYRVVQPKLRPAIYEVTECVPNQRFMWAQNILGGNMVADHRLRPYKGGTEIELSFSTDGLFANLVGRIFSKLIAQYVATEARSLKIKCDYLAAEVAEVRSVPNSPVKHR
jgi:hypothetical protein